MRQLKIPAAFIRGGTSNAIVFNASDLPDRMYWDDLFLAAIGSPDPYGRQLDGMGGGISSLSKVCVVGPPSRPDADLDYTFAQVSVADALVDYGSNCGNMSSAMGPFAIDEGLVKAAAANGEATVRIHNTNTNKIIAARFRVEEGLALVDGPVEIPGVAGTGAAVDLDFLEPGGAGTGALLPTGNVIDRLTVPGHGAIDASLVDAANAFVFVDARTLGLDGSELPAEIDARTEVMAQLEAIRAEAGVLMGYATSARSITSDYPSVPKIGFVAPPAAATTLTGEAIAASEMDLTGRMVSMGNVHRALPLTGVLGFAVAAQIEGTLVHRATRKRGDSALLRLAHPSGIVEAAADVSRTPHGWQAAMASVRRTQRRLFDGYVYVPASRVPALSTAMDSAAD